MKTLVWLRSDLRLWDNPALFHAAEQGQGVIAFYIICKEYLVRHNMASVRLDFIRRNLCLLAKGLAELHIPLRLIVVDHAREVPLSILNLTQQEHCDALYFNAEYPLDEFNRDRAVADCLRKNHITVKRFHDRAIIPPGMIRNEQGESYKVFTAFKRKWLRTVTSVPLATLAKPKVQVTLPAESDVTVAEIIEQLNQTFAHYELRDLSAYWPAGEAEAHQRLKHFVAERIVNYKARRDFPDIKGTSTLSPYLSLGVISPRQCLASVLADNGGEWDTGSEGTACWISEIIWREFYQHVVVDFPDVCKHRPMKSQTDLFPWQKNPSLFQRWCDGKTGFPLIDAAMRQLQQTGWMHNRLRMVVAMFLTKSLQIDWRLGEAYFMRMLIDGDFAANNGGWQWSASTGTDAAPYFRIFNPVSQSQRFDPEGSFIRQFVPELEGVTGKAIHLPPASQGYYEPIVDLTSSRKHTIELFKSLGTK